jgi:hypothetical protein
MDILQPGKYAFAPCLEHSFFRIVRESTYLRMENTTPSLSDEERDEVKKRYWKVRFLVTLLKREAQKEQMKDYVHEDLRHDLAKVQEMWEDIQVKLRKKATWRDVFRRGIILNREFRNDIWDLVDERYTPIEVRVTESDDEVSRFLDMASKWEVEINKAVGRRKDWADTPEASENLSPTTESAACFTVLTASTGTGTF